MSVAKPGYSSVVTSAATSFSARCTRKRVFPFAADLDAAFPELGDERGRVLRVAVGEQEFAAGDGSRDEECAGFDAVGNDGVRRAVKSFDALDADRGRARAFDFRAHFDEQLGEIGDFRLERAVFKNGFALGEHRRRQNIFGAGDGDFGEAKRGAAQALGARFDVAVIDVKFPRPAFRAPGCAGRWGARRWRSRRAAKRARSRSAPRAGRA